LESGLWFCHRPVWESVSLTGEAFTVWSVRAATLLYIAALALWLTATGSRAGRTARLAWTTGCLLYLAHVYAAFEYFHGWSHPAAYAETARQTAELLGVEWGGGLFFNYAFTAVWAVDVIWWWCDPEHYEKRPRWTTAAIQTFLAFMFFNGAVVFASGFSRWLGVVATPALIFLWWRSRTAARRITPLS
jgi:hypothetical protein